MRLRGGLNYIYWVSVYLQFATDNVFFPPNYTEDSRPAGGDVVEGKENVNQASQKSSHWPPAQGSLTSRQKHEAFLPTSKF